PRGRRQEQVAVGCRRGRPQNLQPRRPQVGARAEVPDVAPRPERRGGSAVEADAAEQGESESTAGGAADEAGARRVLVGRPLRPSGGDRPIVQTGKPTRGLEPRTPSYER